MRRGREERVVDVELQPSPVEPPRVPDDRWGRSILVLVAALVVAGAVFVGLQKLAGDFDLTSPLEPVLSYGGALAAGMLGVVLSLRTFFRQSAKPVVIMLAVALPVFVVLALVLIATNDDTDLEVDRALHRRVAALSREDHKFEIDDGDRAIVTLRGPNDWTGELIVQRGSEVFSGSPAAGGRALVVDETLTGGTWEVEVASATDRDADYTLTLEVDPARQVRPGDAYADEALIDAADSNGYVLHTSAARKVVVVVDNVSAPELLPDASVLVNGFRRNVPMPRNELAIPVSVEAGARYVVVVTSPSGASGSYRFALFDDSEYATATAVPTTVDTPLMQPDEPGDGEPVPVPDVFGDAQDDAERTLIAAGFAVRSFNVCSSSVDAGLVRQVVIAADQGRDVVDAPGTDVDVRELPAGTELALKVSTGAPCTD
jgi:hypothetical protein